MVEQIDSGGLADHDFGDLVVMPGLVDSHVHVNEPGRTEWEGFASATRAAAAGGTTSIVDMPLNSIPPTVSVDALRQKRESARSQIVVDVAFWGGLVPGSEGEIDALVDEGVCGFKAFMVDSGVSEFPPVDEDQLANGLTAMADGGVPALVHAEDGDHFLEPAGDPRLYLTYLDSRPVLSEVRAVEKAIAMATESGATLHILHVSSGEASAAIGASSGAVSGETCPHYLTFASSEIPEGATAFKCAPPIREPEQREALWDALGRGDLGMIVSDHSPAPPDLKAIDSGDFTQAWGGIASLQIRLPAVWHGASSRGFDFPELADWLSRAPAALAGLDDRKGSIEVGHDADFVIWDPDAVTKVTGLELEHRHPVTPFEGMELRGRVVATVLGGLEVFSGDAVHRVRGRMLRRK